MTDTSQNVPDLQDLLKDSPSNWGKWGDDDEVGSLNYLGPEQVLAAVRLVKSGKLFTLQRLIGDPKGDPVWPGRTPAERTQVFDESSWDGDDAPQFPGGLHYADDKINAFLQGSTQYAGVDPAEVDDVIMGAALQQGAQANIGAPAALRAGLPVTVAGMSHRPPVRVGPDGDRHRRQADHRRRHARSSSPAASNRSSLVQNRQMRRSARRIPS